MHKLLKADLILILLTFAGVAYLHYTQKISIEYSALIVTVYMLSKIIAYIVLPYNKFEVFLNVLIDSSKSKYLSGFEIFKISLIALLYIGFLFIDPAIWIIESILVVMMRIWGVYFFKKEEL